MRPSPAGGSWRGRSARPVVPAEAIWTGECDKKYGVPRCCYRIAIKGGTMSYASQLLDTYPRTFNVDARVLAATIDALNDCAQACTADSDDDLSEPNVADLIKCIRLCLDCADICT